MSTSSSSSPSLSLVSLRYSRPSSFMMVLTILFGLDQTEGIVFQPSTPDKISLSFMIICEGILVHQVSQVHSLNRLAVVWCVECLRILSKLSNCKHNPLLTDCNIGLSRSK